MRPIVLRRLSSQLELLLSLTANYLGYGEETVDLLTEEHHESILPRVDYAKAPTAAADDGSGDGSGKVGAHIALLVDAFSEEGFDFRQGAGKLNPYPEWQKLAGVRTGRHTWIHRAALAAVDICAPPCHTGPVHA